MAVDIQEATSWPVNELGEIVAQAGVGTNTIVGWLPSSMLPLDITTNKISIVSEPKIQEKSVILYGDSTWGNTNVNAVPATTPTYDPVTGLLTLNITSHGNYTGMDCRVACTGFPVWNIDNVKMTRIDANNLSVVIKSGITDVIPTASKWRFYTNVSLQDGTPFSFLRCGRPTLVNMGVNGETVEEILARKDAVIASPVKTVFMRCGANNASNDISGATTNLAQIEPVVEQLVRVGKTVVLTLIPPVGTGANQGRYIRTLNDGLLVIAKKYGCLIADEFSAYVDPTNATGSAKANYLQSDNTHSTSKGSRIAAAVWQPIVDSIFGTTPSSTPKSGLEGYHVTNNPSARNVFSNPMLLTATGGTNGSASAITATAIAGGTKVYATGGWGAGSVTATVPAEANGNGNCQRLVGSPTAALDQMKITTENDASAMAGRCVSGSVYKGAARIRCSGLTGQNIVRACTFQVSFTNAEGSFGKILDHTWNAALSNNEFLCQDFDRDFETPPFTLPAGVTSIYLDARLTFGGAGTAVTFEVAQLGLVLVS